MHKLIRFYNFYKKNIWVVIGGLTLIIVVLQLLNNNAKNKQLEINKRKNEINSSSNTTIYNTPAISSSDNYNKENSSKKTEILNTFLEKCNSQKVEEAYELLSDYCKTEMFSNVQEFKNEYINSLFKTKKIYDVQLWMAGKYYIYKISMYENVLETGKIQNGINSYYTVIEENGSFKININDFVSKEVINREFENEYLKISVLNKYIYMDYEEYEIKIVNKTDKTILMDGYRKNQSLYLIDSMENKKLAYINEIPKRLLAINSATIITRNIKFYKSYTEEIDSTQIVFSDIILNYNEYENQNNKKTYNNTLKVEIDL